LVAIFPPHSTHQLQPLDVSLFGPLATYYSQQADDYTRRSMGMSDISKRDFFKNFLPAYYKAFTDVNIRSGWCKTGLEPFNPEQVLNQLKKEEQDGSSPSSRHSSSCLDSPRAMRTIRRIVNEAAAHRDAQSQRTIEKLAGAALTLSAELVLAREREKGLMESIDNEKNKRKRSRAFTEELRAQEGLGVLFFSPSKVARARELQAAKDATKDDEALDRLLQAQDRTQQKAQKQLEAQQRREDRAIRATARKTQEALKRAQRQHQKEAKKAQRQLQIKSRVSITRPRKKQKTQEAPKDPIAVIRKPEPQLVVEQPRLRNGRTVRKPRRFDDI
jgi:hypothetical protein